VNAGASPGASRGAGSCSGRRPLLGSAAAVLLLFEPASFCAWQPRCGCWRRGRRRRCWWCLAGSGLVVVEAGEGVVAFGAEPLVLVVEVLVLGGEPAPSAVLDGMFAAGAVDLGLERLGSLFRCFQLLAEITDLLPRSGEFVAVIESLDQGGWLVDTVGAVAPGALAVGVGAPFAGASAFAGDGHEMGA
jgi:hypothetical protein